MGKIVKRTLLILGIIAVLLIVIATTTTYFLIPMYLSSDKGKAFLQAKMSEALSGKVSITDTKMSWSGGLTVKGLKVDNAKKDGTTFWMDVAEVKLVPSYLSLVTNTIVVGSLALKEPSIVMKIGNGDESQPSSKVENGKYDDQVKGFKIKDLSITNGNIKFKNATYPDVTNINVDCYISVKPSDTELHLNDFSINIQDGTIKASGYYVTKPDLMSLKVGLDVKEVRSLAYYRSGLKYVLPLFETGWGDVDCLITLKGKLEGSGKDVAGMLNNTRGEGELFIKDGRFSNCEILRILAGFLDKPSLAKPKFDTISEKFAIKGSKVYNTLTEADGKEVNLTMTGWVDFDLNMDYRVKFGEGMVKVDKNGWDLVKAANEAGGIRIKGTLNAPQLAMDADMIKKGAANILMDKVLDGVLKKVKKQ